jgi:hydrogenase expression/formation protein HypC
VCLGEVGSVREARDDGTLTVEARGRVLTVSSLTLNEPAKPGDWILVHSGFALARLDPSDARDALAIRTGNWEDAEP